MFRITDWRNPYPILMWAYAGWNIYHFGMQNYGVFSIWRRPRRRLLTKIACVGISTSWMLATMAMFGTNMGAQMSIVNSFNHWVVELGLGFRVMRYRWYFIVGVMTVGLAWGLVTVFRTTLIVEPQCRRTDQVRLAGRCPTRRARPGTDAA